MKPIDFVDRYKTGIVLTLVAILTILAMDGAIAFAADIDTNIVPITTGDDDWINADSSSFNTYMKDWLSAMRQAAMAISTVMIVLGGLNIALNNEPSSISKIWSACLGLGLIINIGSVFEVAQWSGIAGSIPQTPDFNLTISNSDKIDFKAILDFPMVYQKATIQGANFLIGPACKLLLVLTAIKVMIQVSLDLVEGDKIKYMTMTLLETGAYFFLITNWYGGAISDAGTGGVVSTFTTDKNMNIMGNLCAGFEQLGYNAGGQTNLPANNILENASKMFMAVYGNGIDGFNPATILITLIFCIIILILLFLTGLEMFMARIEFWTLAMATIIMVPFAALPQTRFLFSSALGGMMNLAIKVSVIGFIAAISTTILSNYVTAFTAKDAQLAGNIPLFIQALLVSALLYLITKQIPQLVSSLLSGSPSLQGATMKQMASNAVSTGAKVGTAVATGGASMVKAAVGGAMEGGFKAAGTAAATGGNQMLAGIGGALKGGLNAGAGSMLAGGVNLAKQALLGGSGAGGASGGGIGGPGGGGGLLAPFQRGAQIGKAFNAKNPNGAPGSTYKTFTSQTGIDKVADKASVAMGKTMDAVNNAGGVTNLVGQKATSAIAKTAGAYNDLRKNGVGNTVQKAVSTTTQKVTDRIQNTDAYVAGYVKGDDSKKKK